MFNFKAEVEKASQNKKALGHFNVSNFEMLKAVLQAGQEFSETASQKIPLIIGLSESERKYLGGAEMVAFIKKWRARNHYPVFINADHCHTFESAKEAAEDGFESTVIDNSKLSFDNNLHTTKKTVNYFKGNYPNVLLEGELGMIGEHSALFDRLPKNVDLEDEKLATVGEVVKFATDTGIDFLAPAVGNMHGMLKDSFNPDLNIGRIQDYKELLAVPMVLHGASGLRSEEIKKAVEAGMAVVHISTELRNAYCTAVKNLNSDFFAQNPDEVAPYKVMQPVIQNIKDLVKKKLKLFN